MNISYVLNVTEVAALVLVLRAKAGQEKLRVISDILDTGRFHSALSQDSNYWRFRTHPASAPCSQMN
jgi:hypothetical protein